MPSYNLVTEPWIPCLTVTGQPQERGLLDVLTSPHDVREIVDTSPLVTVALYRLLLAILHRALDGPPDVDEWCRWWDAGCWPIDRVRGYLRHWQHRFDLFDPERPFYQHPGVERRYAAESARLATELASSFNAPLLFDHSLPDRVALSPAQAARYLVAFQAFAPGGLLSGPTSADRASKAAPLCNVAVCLGKGEDLPRTLLLDLLPRSRQASHYMPPSSCAVDLPAWERPDLPGDQPRWPCGYVDYLTWQARRVLLLPEEQNGSVVVRRCVIMRGESFPVGFEQWQLETMVPYRKAPTQGWVAVAFREDRALWRDSLALVQTVSGGGRGLRRPHLVDWWSELYRTGVLPREIVPLDVAGFVPDQAKPLFWRYERFPLPLAILDDEVALAWIAHYLDLAEQAARVLAASLLALVGELGVPKNQASAVVGSLGAERVYWSSLEPVFFPLLHRLAQATTPPRELCEEWRKTVRLATLRAFEQAVTALLRAGRLEFEVARAENQLRTYLRKLACGARVSEGVETEEVPG